VRGHVRDAGDDWKAAARWRDQFSAHDVNLEEHVMERLKLCFCEGRSVLRDLKINTEIAAGGLEGNQVDSLDKVLYKRWIELNWTVDNLAWNNLEWVMRGAVHIILQEVVEVELHLQTLNGLSSVNAWPDEWAI
jgi:hypothetical protein